MIRVAVVPEVVGEDAAVFGQVAARSQPLHRLHELIGVVVAGAAILQSEGVIEDDDVELSTQTERTSQAASGSGPVSVA